MSWEVRQGSCFEVLAGLEPCSVDSIVTDPPYGIRFMGKAWDGADIEANAQARAAAKSQPPNPDGSQRKNPRLSRAEEAGKYNLSATSNQVFQAWCEAWAEEALRVLKPGGHLLAFGGPRTYHRLTAGIEDAGFEIRDCLAWMFGSGFPKSYNIGKALADDRGHGGDFRHREAAAWSGHGTALKPAFEPIVLARKPLAGTVAANALEHGTGALNIDGCRVPFDSNERVQTSWASRGTATVNADAGAGACPVAGEDAYDPSKGRWPANVILDPEAGAILDEQTGELVSGPESDKGHRRNADRDARRNTYGGFKGQEVTGVLYGDRGGPSRFFYNAKSSRAERNAGLDGARNHHPTVKPIDLMRWLVRLVTPPDGLVLDPFTGSGTTGIAAVLEGFDFLGVEREAEYVEIAEARIEWWHPHAGQETAAILERAGLAEKARAKHEELGQLNLMGEVAA